MIPDIASIFSGWDLLNKSIRYQLALSVLVGLCIFLVESGFAMALQGFLVALGLMSSMDGLLPAWWPSGMLMAVVIVVAAGILRSAGHYIRTVMGIEAQQTFLRNYRYQVFQKGLSNSAYESSSNIVTVFTEVVFKASGIVPNFVQLFISTTLCITLFFGCLSLAGFQTIWAMLVLVIFFGTYQWISRHVSHYGKLVGEKAQSVNSTLLNAFRHIQFLRIHGALGECQRKMAHDLIEYETHNMRYVRISTLKGVIGQTTGVIVVAVVAWASPDTPPGIMLAFFYLFSRLAVAANDLSGCLTQGRFLRSYVERLRRDVGLPEERPKVFFPHSWNPRKLGGKLNKLCAHEVSFKWAGANNMLFKDLSVEIRPGELLLLKGESGVGKSTLAAILLGLISPTKGEVKLDGKSEELLTRLSPIAGYVGPEPILLTGTLRENLLYGIPSDCSINDEEIKSALTKVGLSEIANASLDTPLFEHAALSTGQKQRICFARAMIREPSIIVLDEATANLDEDNEQALLSLVKLLMKNGVAFIAITHRASFDSFATHKIHMKTEVV